MGLPKKIWRFENKVLSLHRLKISIMKDDALSIANYFIDKANSEGGEIKPLRLMKLVYIAHGFMLALVDRSVFNPRFDVVEAWKFGPVIPSVYHTFKRFKDHPITEKAVVFMGKDGEITFEEPVLKDKEAKLICDFVWKRYRNFNDNELVSLTHERNTPWAMVYQEGKNNIIPDEFTRLYYKGLVSYMRKKANGG